MLIWLLLINKIWRFCLLAVNKIWYICLSVTKHPYFGIFRSKTFWIMTSSRYLEEVVSQ